MLIIQASAMKDIFGQALLDYYQGTFTPPLLSHNEYGPPEEVPLERYFLSEDEFTDLETFSIEQFHGKILDIGSATGRHVRYLQSNGYDITAMDISPFCGIVMENMGIDKIVIEDVYTYNKEKYDTISMLMNGIGIAGNINRLEHLLQHLKGLIKPSGQILLDSSDISYLYKKGSFPEHKYYGELTFHFEYKGVHDEPFGWLYIDQKKLIEVANSIGWSCQIIFEDETEAYLARLQFK